MTTAACSTAPATVQTSSTLANTVIGSGNNISTIATMTFETSLRVCYATKESSSMTATDFVELTNMFAQTTVMIGLIGTGTRIVKGSGQYYAIVQTFKSIEPAGSNMVALVKETCNGVIETLTKASNIQTVPVRLDDTFAYPVRIETYMDVGTYVVCRRDPPGSAYVGGSYALSRGPTLTIVPMPTIAATIPSEDCLSIVI